MQALAQGTVKQCSNAFSYLLTARRPRIARCRRRLVLANRFGATLTLFHALPKFRSHYYPEGAVLAWPPEKEYLAETAKLADDLLAHAKSTVERKGVKVATVYVYSDSPAEAIVAAATKAKADVIVIASHGRQGLQKLLLGSETQKVLALTKLPVLVVR